MVAKTDRIKMIQKMVRTEMGISVTSLEGAMASIKDTEFQQFTWQHNKEGREYVMGELKKAGITAVPSQTNFILFPIQMPTKELLGKMMEKGVGIRGYEIGGKPFARVSMGTMDELKLFVGSLNSIIS
jgi:histidinol-phosphate aminotransferase